MKENYDFLDPSKYTQQIGEQDYDGQSVRSFIEYIFEDLKSQVVGKSVNNIFVWKEDSSGIDFLESRFDGNDMIDQNKFHEVIVIEKDHE